MKQHPTRELKDSLDIMSSILPDFDNEHIT